MDDMIEKLEKYTNELCSLLDDYNFTVKAADKVFKNQANRPQLTVDNILYMYNQHFIANGRKLKDIIEKLNKLVEKAP